MPFQAVLAQAVAEGIIKSVKASGLAAGGVGDPATGPGHGISGLSASSMTSAAKGVMSDMNGSTGDAIEPLLDGVFESVVDEMSNATITSVSGKGGAPLQLSGITGKLVESAILSAFPGEAGDQVKSSQSGMTLVKAIAEAFADEFTSSGKAGTIPSSGSSPGPIVAKIS